MALYIPVPGCQPYWSPMDSGVCSRDGKRTLLARSRLSLGFRESDPRWDEEIKEDVTAECSKFGVVEHAFVDINSKVGRSQ